MVEPTPPVAALAAPAARAAAWLQSCCGNRPAGQGLDVDALALARLCDVLDPAASAVERLLAGWTRDTAPAWHAGHLLPGLLAAAAALSTASPFARSAAEYLVALADLSGGAAGRGQRLLAVILDPSRVAAEASPWSALPARVACAAGRGDIEALAGAIEDAGAYGLCGGHGDPPPVAGLLEGYAIAALRAYDLPYAMRILRALACLGSRKTLGMRTGLAFLGDCQDEDGSFGDVDTPIARLRAAGADDAYLRLKLPLTLQALWTMAEIESPSFRLVRDAFPSNLVSIARKILSDAE